MGRELRIPRWLSPRHLQTVSAALPLCRGEPAGIRSEIRELIIPEGGVLVARCAWQPKPAPAVLVLHGVGGTSEDAYVIRAARELLHAGFHTISLNQRGSGLGAGRARRIYHAGLTEDVHLTLDMIGRRDDVTEIGILGFSLGGHVALRTLAEIGSSPNMAGKLRTLAAISPPVDLLHAAQRFSAVTGLARVYEKLMVQNLVGRCRQMLAGVRDTVRDALPVRLDDLKSIRTIWEFDRAVTVPLYGFRDVEDYYSSVSASRVIENIALPTLLLHAEDDPIVSVDGLRAHKLPSSVEVVVTPEGGHVGFVEELSQLWGSSFAVRHATEWFKRHLR